MSQIDLLAEQADIDLVASAAPGLAPDVALVLGSGLDPVAEALTDRVDLPYSEVAGMRGPQHVAGHSGALSLGRAGSHGVICFRGRNHRYQGVTARAAAYPALLAAGVGAKTFIVTNAAGSVDAGLDAGELMLITDHLNLTGDSPLIGWPGPAGGTPFIPMGDAYDPALRQLAKECAAARGLALAEGIYAGLTGPAYETPAEVRYLNMVGAQAVGMSTVPEVIAARALDLRVLGVSLITNAAGGSELSHEEVLEAGRKAGADLAALLVDILASLP
ncbi:MAG TPA: purine-nucleoside phosphorylase [Coriobacteriia bacterium]|nr:purine-nucleoside phosphorylase [Coriobacteriia bacterium]